MGKIPNPPISLCYLGGPVDIVRNWARLQGASAQQEKVILAALDSNFLEKLPKPKKWRHNKTVPKNRALRSRYYQQVAHIFGWKERHVDGFSDVVRDTLRTVVWPDHGEHQGDMATIYPQGIGENMNVHIDATMERPAMAKGGESKTEVAKVTNQEVHVEDNKDTRHIHKGMVRGKEATGREIEDCCEKGEHYDVAQGTCISKRARTEEEGSGSHTSPNKPKGTTGFVLPKWCQ